MTAARQARPTRTTDGFGHEAAFGGGDGGFLEVAVPFLSDAIDAGVAVLVVAPPRHTELLRDRAGRAAGHAQFLDVTDVGRNPARLIPLVRQFVDGRGSAPAAWALLDPLWPGVDSDHVAEVLLHEALLGLAFADRPPLRLRCVYDLDALTPDLVERVCERHPAVVGGGSGSTSAGWPAVGGAGLLAGPLPELHPSAETVTFTEYTDIRGLRSLVGDRAARAGVGPDRAADLVLAVHEIAVNSLRHGGDRGLLRVWTGVGRVVCEVSDGGHVTDPLVGRVRPLPSQLSGRGVWLANQLCDLVQLRSSAGGTVVRLSMEA